MTVRIPSAILMALAFIMASGVISFVVAFAVTEWRGYGGGYIDCVTRVQAEYVDESERLTDERPGPSSSDATWDKYYLDFDRVNLRWVDDMRDCT